MQGTEKIQFFLTKQKTKPTYRVDIVINKTKKTLIIHINLNITKIKLHVRFIEFVGIWLKI